MRRRRHINGPRQQKGLALLVFAMAVVLAGSGVLLHRLNEAVTGRGGALKRDASLLSAVKSDLLGYYLLGGQFHNTPDTPQEAFVLPCPDSDRDGRSNDSGTSCTALHGWLPYEDLARPPTQDSSGAGLWYAINHDVSLGGKESDACGSGDTRAAVLVAPGPDSPLAQDGDSIAAALKQMGMFDITNVDGSGYIDLFDVGESVTVAGFAEFIGGGSGAKVFNARRPSSTQVLLISKNELLQPLRDGILKPVSEALIPGEAVGPGLGIAVVPGGLGWIRHSELATRLYITPYNPDVDGPACHWDSHCLEVEIPGAPKLQLCVGRPFHCPACDKAVTLRELFQQQEQGQRRPETVSALVPAQGNPAAPRPQ